MFKGTVFVFTMTQFHQTFLTNPSNCDHRNFDVIYEQRERVFHRDIQTRENNVSMYHFMFLFGYPGETRARVVYMASQMNRDVTECFRLLV
jgi:hypothetical protein